MLKLVLVLWATKKNSVKHFPWKEEKIFLYLLIFKLRTNIILILSAPNLNSATNWFVPGSNYLWFMFTGALISLYTYNVTGLLDIRLLLLCICWLLKMWQSWAMVSRIWKMVSQIWNFLKHCSLLPWVKV